MVVADAIDSSRAALPVDSGFADVDGVRIGYEVFGHGARAGAGVTALQQDVASGVDDPPPRRLAAYRPAIGAGIGLA